MGNPSQSCSLGAFVSWRRLRDTAAMSLAGLAALLLPMALSGVAYGQTSTPNGAVSVTDFGAVSDDGQDDSAAFRRALEAAPVNGLVVVPPGRYELDSTVTLENRHLRGEGLPTLLCRMTDTCIEVAGWQGDRSQGGAASQLFGSRLESLRLLGQGELRRAVWVSVGDYPRLERLLIQDITGDCVLVQPRRDFAWIENLSVSEVKCDGIGRDGFVVRLPREGDQVFVNESVWSNIETRGVTGRAFVIDNPSLIGGGEAKISKLQVQYSEFDSAGSSAAPVVGLETENDGLIEFILFHWVTIESTRATRRGPCLEADASRGGRIERVHVTGSICYGTGSGVARRGNANVDVEKSAGF